MLFVLKFLTGIPYLVFFIFQGEYGKCLKFLLLILFFPQCSSKRQAGCGSKTCAWRSGHCLQTEHFVPRPVPCESVCIAGRTLQLYTDRGWVHYGLGTEMAGRLWGKAVIQFTVNMFSLYFINQNWEHFEVCFSEKKGCSAPIGNGVAWTECKQFVW